MLCSVPDILVVVAVRRESAHSGGMRLEGGCRVVIDHAMGDYWYVVQPDVCRWPLTTLHDPAGIQANR
jgi:hypothetical protein